MDEVKGVKGSSGTHGSHGPKKTASGGSTGKRQDIAPGVSQQDQFDQSDHTISDADTMAQARQVLAQKMAGSIADALESSDIPPDLVDAVKKGGNIPPEKQAELFGKVMGAMNQAGVAPQIDPKDVPKLIDQAVQAGKLTPEQGQQMKQRAAAIAQAKAQNPGGGDDPSDPGRLPLGFMYPSVQEMLPGSKGSTEDDQGFTLNGKQQEALNNYGDKIKNVLSWNIMTQMLVKGSQMALDSFLLGQKWQYEQQITVMQFMQTMAQMALGYINNMSQSWDQLWSQYKQKQEQVNQGMLQAISGGR